MDVLFDVTVWLGRVESNHVAKVVVRLVIFKVEETPSVTAV